MSDNKKTAKRKKTPINIRIGKRIKTLRVESGLKQDEFADKYHLEQGDVSLIENGRKTVSYELLLDIAKDYNQSTDYFIKENGVRANNPDLQYICDYTGLSEEAISTIRENCIFDSSIFSKDNYVDTTDFEIEIECEKERKKQNKEIINEFIMSDVFQVIVDNICRIKDLETDGISFLSLFFKDYNTFERLNSIDYQYDESNPKEKTISLANRFCNEYSNSDNHNEMINKRNLIIYNTQRAIIDYFEKQANLLFTMESANLTNAFDIIMLTVYLIIKSNVDENDFSIETFEHTLNRFTNSNDSDLQNEIEKIKEIYKGYKNE